MSINLGIRLFVSLIFGAVLTCNLFLGEDRDLGADSSSPDTGRRYVPYIGSGLLLPMILLALLTLAVVTNGFSFAADQLFSVLLGIFLHASLYYMVLMPLLPAQPSVIRFFADLRGVDGRVNRTEFEFYYAPDPS